jgi:hypothetical protein
VIQIKSSKVRMNLSLFRRRGAAETLQ